MSDSRDEVVTVPTMEMQDSDGVYLVHNLDARINKLFEQTMELEEEIKADEQEVQSTIREISSEIKQIEIASTSRSRWYKRCTSVWKDSHCAIWIRHKLKRCHNTRSASQVQASIQLRSNRVPISTTVHEGSETEPQRSEINADAHGLANDGESIITTASEPQARATGKKYRQLQHATPRLEKDTVNDNNCETPELEPLPPALAPFHGPATTTVTTGNESTVASSSTAHDTLSSVPMTRQSYSSSSLRDSRIVRTLRRGVPSVITRREKTIDSNICYPPPLT